MTHTELDDGVYDDAPLPARWRRRRARGGRACDGSDPAHGGVCLRGVWRRTHKLPRSWILCRAVVSSSFWLDSMNSVRLRTFWNLTNLRRRSRQTQTPGNTYPTSLRVIAGVSRVAGSSTHTRPASISDSRIRLCCARTHDIHHHRIRSDEKRARHERPSVSKTQGLSVSLHSSTQQQPFSVPVRATRSTGPPTRQLQSFAGKALPSSRCVQLTAHSSHTASATVGQQCVYTARPKGGALSLSLSRSSTRPSDALELDGLSLLQLCGAKLDLLLRGKVRDVGEPQARAVREQLDHLRRPAALWVRSRSPPSVYAQRTDTVVRLWDVRRMRAYECPFIARLPKLVSA